MSFCPTISVRVSSDFVTFTEGARSCGFLPRLYLDSDSPSAIILSVGDPPLTSRSIRVDLFSEPLRALDYSSLLAAFLRQGFFLVRRRGFFRPRPHVSFVVPDSMRGYLRNYHRSIFSSAALEAGAISVHFTFSADQDA